MSSFKTPDVYTEEVPTLPPSVAEVSTAVPAFIGFTETATKDGKNVSGQAIRISTFLEYKEIFGKAQAASFTVKVVEDAVKSVQVESPKSTLYHALDLYFKNGGGDCYIISVGNYKDTYNKEAFTRGLEALSKEDEPTLIMLGEAIRLSAQDYYDVCVSALAQCANLKDRFCIFDVKKNDEADEVADFRNKIGTNNLKYGAAYTPYLYTSLNYVYKDEGVNIEKLASNEEILQADHGNAIRVTYSGEASDNPRFKINKTGAEDFKIAEGLLTIGNIGEGKSASEVVAAWNAFQDQGKFNIEVLSEGDVKSTDGTTIELESATAAAETATLAEVKKSESALYSKVVSELAKQKITMPPSAAIAGAYATTDRERGVWKAPANLSLNSVVGPTKKITSGDQESLNVDPTAGKSINAIRSFVGRGTMVWGARTLAGNDNEWRYVPVRRLFNMIEESTKKASYFAVFESNDAVTWLKVKAMIESFLYGIWQQGGLVGTTQDQAYFVNVGLGKTMTQQDILEGRMIVEIGLAAARPAEFVVLRFSHKLQEA